MRSARMSNDLLMLDILYRGKRGKKLEDVEIYNLMGWIFQYKDPELVKGLLRNIDKKVISVFSDQMTIVYDDDFSHFDILRENTPAKIWRKIECGQDVEITVKNLNMPHTKNALNVLNLALNDNSDTLYFIPITLRGEHMNMLAIQKKIGYYFEPHNLYDIEEGDELPYGKAMELFEEQFNIKFETMSCPNLTWQSKDNFCQSWSHWYLMLRMQGYSHEESGKLMSKKGIQGLQEFLKYCFQSVNISVKVGRGRSMMTAEYPSIENMIENPPGSILSILNDAKMDFKFKEESY